MTLSLKTAGTSENAYKGMTMALYYCQPWSTTYSRVYGTISGTLVKRVNASSSLDLTYMNPKGRYTEVFRPGGKIKLCMDRGFVDTVNPQFIGYLTPGSGIKHSGDKIGLRAVGMTNLLGRELWSEREYVDADGVTWKDTLEGYEAGAAIRELVESMNGTPIDGTGIVGSNPVKLIPDDISLPEGTSTKLAVIESIISQMMDTSIMADIIPRPYYWYDRPVHGSDKPQLAVHKFPNLATAYSTRTLEWDDNILEHNDNLRTEQVTSCTAVSSEDDTIFETYTNQSGVDRYGLWEKPISVGTVNRDELQAAAIRYVMSHLLPIRSIELALPYAYDLRLLQVITLESGPYGSNNKHAIMELSLPFGVQDSPATVTLASQTEVLTDFL